MSTAPSWLQLVNCGLCDETIAALEKRNIRSLFPIQKHVFEPAQQGRDLIGRARTGSGKTLAFALPVIENLLQVRDLRKVLLPMQGPSAVKDILHWGHCAFSRFASCCEGVCKAALLF